MLSANARFNDRQTINSEMFGLYKSQIDADFGLYKNQRDQFDVLADRIGKLETAAAVEPWRSKVTKMEIPIVNKSLVLNQQDLNELKDMLSH